MAISTAALPQITRDEAKTAQAAADRAALAKSFSLQNPLLAAGMDVLTLPGRGLGGAYNTAARLPNAFGANLPTISDTSPFFGGNSASMTPYFDRLRAPEQPSVEMPKMAATPAPVAEKTPAPVATTAAAATEAKPTAQSNWDKANEFAQQQAAAAGGDPNGSVYRTSLALALHGLNAETQAQAQDTQAQTGRGQQLMTPHVISQEEEIDPVTGMSTRNKNIYGTYNPETKGWEPIKMPTIEKKAPLPPKADLKAGQVYPGYGKWTGTGFIPQ